jgi:exopolyphosphatase/guanosine-5'-triphosphate,3'-diphosphate pyrophosphatase
MTLGIIDVGTNSIHLLLGILGLTGRFHVILKERDLTRLGAGGLARGRLTAGAMNRALGVLRAYAGILRRCGAERVEAVATSAVRDAANGRAFVARVRRQTGLPLRIITGREEARLIYLGIMQTHRFRRAALIITIGGGSAQVMDGDGAQLRFASSLPLGGARLAQQFLRRDPARPQDVAALRRHLDRAWRPVARAVRRRRWAQALGCSATIGQLLEAAYTRARGHRPADRRRLAVRRRDLVRLAAWLTRSKAAARRRLPGIDPRREDLLLPTALALVTWMEACGVGTLRFAEGSLREGLVIDHLRRHYLRIARAARQPHPELLSRINGHGPRLVRVRRREAARLLRQMAPARKA